MLFLGIDGGGTKTAFLLEDDNGREISRVETGPSNWLSVGPSQAQKSIAEGIEKLSGKPDVVCGGFAGAGRPEGLHFYRECVQTLLPGAKVSIETDGYVSYVGAIGVEPGILLIAGTGSIAVARKPDGTMIRVGGWGPVFGDEGSGYWIGREAIRSALRSHDAQASAEFVTAIRKALRLESITDVVAAWTAGRIDVPTIASLASIVFQQYPSEPSRRILTEAAAHLRAIAETAIAQVGRADCPRAISGSIGSNPTMRQLLGMEFADPKHRPERGAIILARQG